MQDIPSPRDLISLVAEHLGDLTADLTFLGGAVVCLLVTEPSISPPRPTRDVDVVVDMASRFEYNRLEARLRKLGFINDMKGPVCRFIREPLVLDVMPSDESVLGFGNRWYPEVVSSATPYTLENEVKVNLVSAPCFVATKLEAYRSPTRDNHDDPFGSADLEDIVAVVHGRPALLEELMVATPSLKHYVKQEFKRLLETPYIEDAIEGHLAPNPVERSDETLLRLRKVVELPD